MTIMFARAHIVSFIYTFYMLLEEAEEINAAEILVAVGPSDSESLWKIAKSGTLFEGKKPVIGVNNINIFKDLTHIYRETPSRKTKRKWACLLKDPSSRVQHKITPKQESVLVKKFYKDRGRETVDWVEAEACSNWLKCAEKGELYPYLPHSVWKKHLTSQFGTRKWKQTTMKALNNGTTRFTQEYDLSLMKARRKHSNNCFGALADREVRAQLIQGVRNLAQADVGYSAKDPMFVIKKKKKARAKRCD